MTPIQTVIATNHSQESAKQPTFGVYSYKHGRRRSGRARRRQRRRHVQGWFFAGDDALRAAGNDSGVQGLVFLPMTMHFALWTIQVAAEAASREQPQLSIFGCRPCKVLPSPLAAPHHPRGGDLHQAHVRLLNRDASNAKRC